MRLINVAVIAGGAAVMAVGGCDGSGSTTIIKVDGHVFRAAKENLVQGNLSWLPMSQSDGLQFIINPKVPPKEQMMVTIESTKTTCYPKTPPASNQLDLACSAASRADNSEGKAQNFVVEKLHRDGDPTQWEYRLKGQSTVVASCYALSDGGGAGLCTSLSHYKNLVYSIGLRDSDVEHLPSIRKKVNDMLMSWERYGSHA